MRLNLAMNPIFGLLYLIHCTLVSADSHSNQTENNGGGGPVESAECKEAVRACEGETDCLHRLIFLHSTCITNTCQPQCQSAVLNLYQTRLGRNLLRTDMSCMLGPRTEMKLCNLLPNESPIHCLLAKLVCEADLECRSKMDIFIAECDSEVNSLKCSENCAQRFADTLRTSRGAEFSNCTCWKADPLCSHFKENILNPCMNKGTVYADLPNDTKTTSKTSLVSNATTKQVPTTKPNPATTTSRSPPILSSLFLLNICAVFLFCLPNYLVS